MAKNKKTEPYLEEIEGDEVETTMVDGAEVRQDGEDIVVDFSGHARDVPDSTEHDENLAQYIPEGDRIALGIDLVEKVDQDEDSRKEWKRRILEGLEIIGVEEIPTESSAFDGSSTVTHPAIAEAMVRFQANAMEELFPSEGPVKTKVVGKSSPEREEQRTRVQGFMNYKLTEEDDEYFDHTDQMTMYLPYAGSAFKKCYFDMTEGTSLSRFVSADHFVVPYDATSLKTSPRYTHLYKLTGNEINARIASGEFIDTDALDSSGLAVNQNTTGLGEMEQELEDVSDDREAFRAEDDVVYQIYEIHIETIFDEFDEPEGEDDHRVALPYVITVEKDSGEILAIRRLWEEDDPKRRKRVHFIHYKFLPGLGFYGWGYLHIIGSLGKAASGALRALLDGSATASLQGGFKSKESKIAGEFIFTPGVWKDVDMTAEDLAKSFYTPPFKEPSPALFQTLNLLVNGIKDFSSTTEAMTGAADNKGPVGTTLALIEQGSKVYSGIHKRMHKAARFEFKLLAKLNYEHMDEDGYPYDVAGAERSIASKDFDGRVDIIPVSDPNIYSNVQRVAQAQAELELVESAPDLYDREARRQAHMDMHKALRTPDPERLLPKKTTKRLDPVTENQIILTGGAVEAFPEQDHMSHIQAHEIFMQEAAGMQLDENMMSAAMVNMGAHLAGHHAHAYRLRIEQTLGVELPDTDFKDVRDEEDVPIEIDNAVARAVAKNVAPPPPAQGPEPSEEEKAQEKHEQALQHKQEDHDLSLRHKQEAHGLNLEIKEDDAAQSHRKKAVDNVLDNASKAASVKE
jgi:pSer/pThr/pTyr-binding forkhead associated (FHA) protein